MKQTISQREDNCIFCDIAQNKTAADIIQVSDQAIFFHDISPQAVIHIIGTPVKHITSLGDITAADMKLISRLLLDLVAVAKKLGLNEDGYRVVTNVGLNAGQVVQHLHWHLLGGEKLGPLNYRK